MTQKTNTKPESSRDEVKLAIVSAPEAGGESAVKSDEIDRTVLENFEKAKKEQIRNLEKAFDDRISANIGEKGLEAIKSLKQQQLAAIEALYRKNIEEYQKQVGIDKTPRWRLAQELLDRSKKSGADRVANTQILFNLIEKDSGNKYFSDRDIIELERMLTGVDRLMEANPEIQKIYQRLADKKNLHSNDYQEIIKNFNPNEITSDIKAPQKTFEATSAGLLIALMMPEQRMQFVREFMSQKSPKRAETAKVIDGLLKSGVLTILQGEVLFKEALELKLIDEKTFQNYCELFKNGFYVQEADKLEKAIDEKVARLGEQYVENPLNRYAGAPAIGFIGLLHSAIWFLSNIMTGNVVKNPYTWMALVEGGISLEMAYGGQKKGAPFYGIGHGPVSQGIEWASKKLGAKMPEAGAETQDMNSLSRFYSRTRLREYFSGGGIEKILALRKKKISEQKKLAISVEELLDRENDPLRKTMLVAAQRDYPQQLIIDINIAAELCQRLHMETQEEFNRKIDIILAAQGIDRQTVGAISK